MSIEYKFVTEPSDRFKCLICFDIARDPKQHEGCGKIFCQECIDRCKDKPCPNCREENPKYFTDKRGHQEIQELPVKCCNVESGCNWRGTVSTLMLHMVSCEYNVVPCPNGCKDSRGQVLVLLQKEVLDHLIRCCPRRQVLCQFCKKEGTYEAITGEHDKVCEKKVVSCPQCFLPMERGSLARHVEMSCSLTDIACKFESIGCKVTMKRKDIGTHEESEDKAHLKLALDSLVTLKKEFSDFKQKLFTLKDSAFVFKVSDFSKHKSSNEVFRSSPFYTSSEGYKVQIEVVPNGIKRGKGTHVSVFIRILADGLYNKSLPWPFCGAFILELLNQLSDNDHHTSQIHFGLKGVTPGKDVGRSRFISHSCLPLDSSNKTQYLMNDTLYFRVSSLEVAPNHKPWLECVMTTNFSLKKVFVKEECLNDIGSVLIKMPAYSYKKASGEVFLSNPFWSHSFGYKLRLKVLAGGDLAGKNTHVSVYLRVLKGPYGDNLKWPITGAVQFELLNQLQDSDHHTRNLVIPESFNVQVGSTKGFPTFISHSSLVKDLSKNIQYLVDDSLYFRVAVKVDGFSYKPWLNNAI